MRLGSIVHRYLRSSLALSVVAIAFLASFASRHWLEPILRFTLQRYLPYSSCASCDADQLLLHIVASALITLSYLVISAAFVYLFVLCGRGYPWRGLALGVAAVFAVGGFTGAVELFALWRPVPGLVTGIEIFTAGIVVFAAGMAPVLVPRMEQLLLRAREGWRHAERFIAATEHSLDGFYILRSVRGEDGAIADFEFTYLNQNGERLLGLPREQILGSHLCARLPINRVGGFFDAYTQVVASGEAIVHEFPAQPGEDNTRWIRHQVVRLEDGIAITASDISERKQAEQQAQHRAQHDILTGLPNRSLLHDRLQQAMERADRYQQKVAVFMLDLDSFKQINDTLGHAAGDLVLIAVAKRLRESVRATDSVLRIGGDEFLVIMPDIVEEIDILGAAAKLLAALAREAPSGLEPLMLSGSLGIAIYPTLARTAEDLINRADLAMYQAKYRGGNCYEVFRREGSQASASPLTAGPRTPDPTLAPGTFRVPPLPGSN
jgi:diguanylate cyclase (GGDEF)-like protein